MTSPERRSELAIEPVSSAYDPSGTEPCTAASARLVNRTHRIVRERAQTLKSRRSRLRGLLIPMSVSAAFLVILCTAVWSLLDQYELSPNGVPDASSQIFIFLLWFFPASAAMLALAWARRTRADRESMQ